MAYIGRSVDIGMFEKQVLTPDSSTTTFTLTYAVGSANSLLVVYGGVVQEPQVAYSVSGGGQSIAFSEAPATGTTTYIIYLGKQLTTPRAAGQETTKQTFAGNGSTVTFTLTDPPVVPAGIMVFVDGILQREGSGNNYVSSGSTITFSSAPDTSAEIDVYTLVKEKVSIDTVADGSITATKLAAGAPTWNGAGETVIATASTGNSLRITNTGSGNALLVEDSTNPDASPFVIGANGDVGIGTSSPTAKLDVYAPSATAYSASASSPSLVVGNTNSTLATNFSSIQLFTDGNGRGVVNLNALNNATASSADFAIQTRHSGTLAERLRITSAGNVGIGTSSPAVKLDVNGITGWQGGTTGQTAQIVGASSGINGGGNLRVLSNTTQAVNVGGSISLGGYYISTTNSIDYAQIIGAKENSTSGNTAGYLTFGTRANAGNTTECMRIDSSGNVGIGTSSPSTYGKLTVNDTAAKSVYVRSSSTNFSGLLLENTNSATKWQIGVEGGLYNTAGKLNIGIDAVGPQVVIDSSGNVGIGTSSPSSKFDVVGGRSTFSANSENFSVYLRYNSSTSGFYIGSPSADAMAFSASSGAERMRIDSSGNVGIGLTPSATGGQLQVSGAANRASARFAGNANGMSVVNQNGLTVYSNLSGGSTDQTIVAGNTATTYMAFGIHNGTSYTEKMRIIPTGTMYLGYGGAAPLLSGADVQGLSLTSNSNTMLQIYMIKAAQVEAHFGFKSSTDTNLYVGTGGGIAGIGTYGVYQQNTVNSWTSVSDERFKTELEPITNALDKVDNVRTLTGRFTYDEENGVTRRLPFLIAQDFIEALPEAVDQQNPDKLGLSYSDTIVLAFAAIKELKAIVDAQAVEIAALKVK